MSRILLLDSEKSTVAILTNLLKTEGYKVVSCSDPKKAGELVKSEDFNLVISTAGGTWDKDLELLHLACTEQPATPVIAITENSDTTVKVADMKLFACMEKPLKVDQLLATVQKAVDYNDAALTKNVNMNLQLETHYQFDDIVAESPAMKSVCDMISRVAATDVTVLIFGEAGTGKGVVARTIHENSRRRNKPLVSVDCNADDAGAVLFGKPGEKGALLNADGSTVFLDDVSGLSTGVQSKLMTALKERHLAGGDGGKDVKLDVRTIASTSKKMEDLVAAGRFNADFAKYLKIIFIKVPPLRDRPQDIMPAVRQILQKKVGPDHALPTLDQDVVQILEKYSWPRNLHEIKSVVDHALQAAQGKVITKSCIPAELIQAVG